jgi:predicted GIY-YIG superfamily endonuclease
MPTSKSIVYVLRSLSDRSRYYTGVTSNLVLRLPTHNAGLCQSTAGGRPWEVDLTIEFADEERALKFERYLKSGSGVAFAKRHLR